LEKWFCQNGSRQNDSDKMVKDTMLIDKMVKSKMLIDKTVIIFSVYNLSLGPRAIKINFNFEIVRFCFG